MMSALKTARGKIQTSTFPPGLRSALSEYDALRLMWPEPEVADGVAHNSRHEALRRLLRGLRRLTFKGVCRVATNHSGVCPVYVRGHLSTLTTLMGLFWWNDGGSPVRERLLMLAWKKGATP